MKYSDIELNIGFIGNMRDTAWKKLFPYWYAEDDFISVIGEEIELLKAQGIFSLLNIGLKPPVMVWQNSLDHKRYVFNETINELPASVEMQAPIYKTWGSISIKNNGDKEISDLKIMFNNTDGVLIQNPIPIGETLSIDLENQNYYIANKKIKPLKYGKGLSYFITSQNNEQYVKGTPFHNEILRISLSSFTDDEVNLEMQVILKNVVFEDEQNIEITSLELLPINKVIMYSYFDLPFREEVNGWKKTYEKQYKEESIVIYDMITTHIATKKFYVDVWFKGLEYPYRVGFPCYKDAPEDSSFHINKELDSMGEILGLPRREYKQNIPEEDYPFTYPPFYPFDIEQDYWYYSRLVNEYAYNDLAIDTVDIKDTEDNNVVRLHSIDPFVEDFVVTAQSRYPSEIENVDYHDYIPSIVWQYSESSRYNQSEHHYIEHLLKKDDNYSFTTMQGKDNNNISYETYKSKTLGMWFDLSNLPDDININGFEVILDGESTDNSSDKYIDERSILNINSDILGSPLIANDYFQLKRKSITLGDKDSISFFSALNNTSERVYQEITIGGFSAHANEKYEIPFTYKENGEIIDDINDIGILYYNENDECLGFSKAYYYVDTRKDRVYRFLKTTTPEMEDATSMVFISTTEDYHPFTAQIDIKEKETIHQGVKYYELNGPYLDNEPKNSVTITEEWDNGDLKSLLQKNGLYYYYGLTNENENTSSTVLLHNATLRIYHSPKKSDFSLATRINDRTLDVTITNTGERTLKTNVDIICAENLKLSQNYIDVDLEIGESLTTSISIEPEYNIVDGVYEIITVCEDVTETDYIYIDTKGLIKTGIDILPHFGKYNAIIPLKATVYSEDGSNIDGEEHKIAFYIDDFYVGESYVINGEATYDFVPSSHRFIEAGNFKLTAKYIGSERYAPSQRNTNIFINKNNLNIQVEASETAIQYQDYTIRAIVSTEDDAVINDGTVTILIDGIEIATKEVINNEINYTFEMESRAGEHELTVRYNNTAQYPQTEAVQNLIVIGGVTNISVSNLFAKPTDEVKIKAKVSDINGRLVPVGYIDFFIYDGDELKASFLNESIKNGIASIIYQVPEDAVDIGTKIYDIKAYYHNAILDEEVIYQDSVGNGTITIQRNNVVIESAEIFYGSKYEPLGFYVKIIDAETGAPVDSGEVTIDVVSEDIMVSAQVDDDGGARLVYNPITFSAKEWNELEASVFVIENSPQEVDEHGNVIVQATVTRENGEIIDVSDINMAENAILYRIYDGNAPYEDLNLTKFSIDEYGNLWYETENDASEHIYLDNNGYLYARTALDVKRQYPVGRYQIEISYASNARYNGASKDATLEINEPEIDIDMHSYDLFYDDTINITAYATQYTWDDEDTIWIDEGNVNFFLDNEFVNIVEVHNGLAYIPYTEFANIKKGNHLLTAEYIADVNTYTYVLFNIHQVQPVLEYDINRIFKGKKSKVDVHIAVQNDFPVTGNVSASLNGEIFDNAFFTGGEDGRCNFEFIVPNDIDVEDYVLTLSYSGDSHIEPISVDIPLIAQPLEVDIEYDNITITPSTECTINLDVSAKDKDDISEGQVFIKEIDGRTLNSSLVVNNRATLNITSPNEIGTYQYLIYYENGKNYIGKEEGYLLEVNVIEPVDTIYIVSDMKSWDDDEKNVRFTDGEVLYQEVYENEELVGYIFDDLDEAMNVISDNGTVYIVDDIKIKYDTHIRKPVNIIGYNNAQIIKDIPDLIFEKGDAKIYYEDDFDDFDALYEIEELEMSKLNTMDYRIIDNEIYYIDGKKLVPLFLFSDGKIYSYSSFVPQSTTLYIDDDVFIKNIHFVNADNEDKFRIVNNRKLKIIHSIIEKDIQITNRNDLTINTSLVYCDIQTTDANLDNNWWGKNSAPYSVNNNIILKISADKEPAVIGENFEVTVQLIGANGREYDIPAPEFILTSDTGYFQIDNGRFVNSKIVTEFVDAVQEGKLYATVDNETVSIDVYEYERKTEIILDYANELPIENNIKIKAIVQSCAETSYYLTNGKLTTVEPVNNGYVTFYIDNMSIGSTAVLDSKAELEVYFNSNVYNTDDIYSLKAIYTPSEYYFGSEAEKTFKLMNDACFVSPSGNDIFTGTYDYPLRTIQKAISLGKSKIFLQEGKYDETSILIDGNVTIRKYNGNVTFEHHSEPIFIIEENAQLNIKGIDFIENEDIIFKNYNNLFAEECIFYKNESALVDNSENNATSIRRSAIVDNYTITTTGDIEELKYCWFGTNEPENYLEMPVNDYIVMTVESSKDIIYIGTVAHIRARLDHFKKNNIIFELKEELPLRIAYFATSFGTMRPMKDYTHQKQATSLLNTNEKAIPFRINAQMTNSIYVGQPMKVEFYAQYINNDMPFNGIGYCQIEFGDDRIIDLTRIEFKDGIGVLDGGGLMLDEGEYVYNLTLVDEQTYTFRESFTVSAPSIVLKNIAIDEGDHLYKLMFYADVEDEVGNKVMNQNVKFFIDDKPIYFGKSTKTAIQNGVLSAILRYDNISAGNHILKISTENTISNYNVFEYEMNFKSTEKATEIIFDYNGIQKDTFNDLIIQVLDDEQKAVPDGTITMNINDAQVYVDENGKFVSYQTDFDNLPVQNGFAVLKDFKIREDGQYSIVIYYSGSTGYYKESIKINNAFNVGLYNVIIDSEELQRQLNTEIGATLKLDFSIRDISGNKIDKGFVRIYLDGIEIGALPVKPTIHLASDLNQVQAGNHNLKFEYTDDTNTYLDTIFITTLKVDKIGNEIDIDTIFARPNSTAYVPYQINSQYGKVGTGELVAYLDGNKIGRTSVTNINEATIPLAIPMILANGDYIIHFEYKDYGNVFKANEADIRMEIIKDTVQIETSHEWYYPNQEFNFEINITDINGLTVNTGEVALFIDNMQEGDRKSCEKDISYLLSFNQVRKYPLTVVYYENDYYAQSTKVQEFRIDDIPINDISFSEDLVAQPNERIHTELIFDTVGGYNVNDGMVDFLFDGKLINRYSVSEAHKKFDLDIPDIGFGEHTISIEYYNSRLFKNFSKQIPITINKRNVEVKIGDDITARQSNEITIEAQVIPAINGMIRYYMGIDEQNLNIIGIQQIGESNSYTYALPKLEHNEYIIRASYEGNSQYNSAYDDCRLYIEKETPTLDIADIEIQYGETINIEIESDMTDNAVIDLAIDGKGIGFATLMNGRAEYSYKAPYVAGEYEIKGTFGGSAVMNSQEAIATLTVIPYKPQFDNSDLEIYIGGTATLRDELLDADDLQIKSGTISYEVDGATRSPNDTIAINGNAIHMSYESAYPEMYQSFETDINVVHLKNDINVSINNFGKIHRGESFNEHISLSSATTTSPINVEASIYDGESEMTRIAINGETDVELTFSALLPDAKHYTLIIVTEENDTFNECTAQFNIANENYTQIFVSESGDDLNSGTENYPVKTLAQAVNLVANDGKIYIADGANDEEVIIDKRVEIYGTRNENACSGLHIIANDNIAINGIEFTNSQVVNNKRAIIENCEFKDGEDSAIINNAEMYVQDCIFENNTARYGGAIYINSQNMNTEINKCTFKQNIALLYGGAIHLNKGNDVSIVNSVFYDSNCANQHGSSISINGNAYIKDNMFYGNNGESEIYIINGSMEAETNIFDGTMVAIRRINGLVTANLNYWGYNDINDIETVLMGDISIDTWLLSDWKVNNYPFEEGVEYTITPVINKYKNRNEAEINEFEISKAFPARVDGTRTSLNEGCAFIYTGETITITIGSQEFIIEPQVDEPPIL